MECLNWGNAFTFKQKGQLCQSAEREFIKLICFLSKNKVFTCLMKGSLFKIKGEIGNMSIGFHSYGQDIYYLDEDGSSGDMYYDYSFNNPENPCPSKDFSVSLHEHFEKYKIIGNDIVKTRNKLLNRRNKLLSKLGNSKQRKERCIEALKKTRRIKKNARA